MGKLIKPQPRKKKKILFKNSTHYHSTHEIFFEVTLQMVKRTNIGDLVSIVFATNNCGTYLWRRPSVHNYGVFHNFVCSNKNILSMDKLTLHHSWNTFSILQFIMENRISLLTFNVKRILNLFKKVSLIFTSYKLQMGGLCKINKISNEVHKLSSARLITLFFSL